jgi:hypothetical protein
MRSRYLSAIFRTTILLPRKGLRIALLNLQATRSAIAARYVDARGDVARNRRAIMFHRIKMLALAAATVAMLLVGSTAIAAPGWRGGFGVGRGWGGYGYRGGYVGGYGVGGYGRYYGGYRGYSPGYYGGYGYGYPGYGYYPSGSYTRYGSYFGSPYYGSSYYPSVPLVYSSPSVVYSAPATVYAAPSARVTVAKPVVPDTLVPDSIISAGVIRLKLPATADGSVNYQLNGTSFTMDPGYSQRFANDRSWNITFDDGTGRMQSHGLTSGNWEFFKASDGRWELRGF